VAALSIYKRRAASRGAVQNPHARSSSSVLVIFLVYEGDPGIFLV